MNVKVKLFAVARELAGADELSVELPEGSTVGQLRKAITLISPDLAAILPQIVFAVDSQYANDHTSIAANSEVACIPPVSGG